jgi:hypothetical protein
LNFLSDFPVTLPPALWVKSVTLTRRSYTAERAVRAILGYIFFFTLGLIGAVAYFYHIHPDLSIEADLPRLRQDVEGAIERARRLRDAWHEDSAKEPAPTLEPQDPTPTTTPTGQARTQD